MANPYLTLAVTKDGTTKSVTTEITAGGAWNVVTDTVAGATTDKQVNCAIDASHLKAIYIVSTEDVTLEANDGSSADFTLTITADKPLVWYSGCGITNPITADVTEFFVTNAGADSASLEIYVEQDPTP